MEIALVAVFVLCISVNGVHTNASWYQRGHDMSPPNLPNTTHPARLRITTVRVWISFMQLHTRAENMWKYRRQKLEENMNSNWSKTTRCSAIFTLRCMNSRILLFADYEKIAHIPRSTAHATLSANTPRDWPTIPKNQCTTGFSTSFFCFCMFAVSTIAKVFQPISSFSLHLENDNFNSNETFSSLV